MEELMNDKRYKLHLKRALMQAHLEVLDEAIRQQNNYVTETDLCYDAFRFSDELLYKKFLGIIEDLE
jgi:hypothetical protein